MESADWLESTKTKFFEHIDYRQGALSVLLKGHLLVEENLEIACSKRLSHPRAITWKGRGGLAAAQKIQLLHALYGSELRTGLVDLLNSFNALRNNAAHNLATRDFQDRLAKCWDNFLKAEGSYGTDQASDLAIQLSADHAKLMVICLWILHQLSDLDLLNPG